MTGKLLNLRQTVTYFCVYCLIIIFFPMQDFSSCVSLPQMSSYNIQVIQKLNALAKVECPVLLTRVQNTSLGPTIRVWYLTLERVIGTVGKTAGLKKMLCDQILFAPYFIGCFLTVLGAIQFQPWHTIMAKLQEDYFTILRTNYMIWPGAQLITFYLIPLHLRVVFVSFIALLWNTYLASQANKSYKN